MIKKLIRTIFELFNPISKVTRHDELIKSTDKDEHLDL